MPISFLAALAVAAYLVATLLAALPALRDSKLPRSLNLGVATSVMLYELFNQHRAAHQETRQTDLHSP